MTQYASLPLGLLAEEPATAHAAIYCAVVVCRNREHIETALPSSLYADIRFTEAATALIAPPGACPRTFAASAVTYGTFLSAFRRVCEAVGRGLTIGALVTLCDAGSSATREAIAATLARPRSAP